MNGALRLIGAVCLVVLFGAPQSALAQDDPGGVGVTVGLGAGVPYGVLGAGIEVGAPRVSFIAGVGTALAGAGWAVGVKVHFFDRSRRLRPFVTGAYGVTAAVVTLGGGSDYTLKGAAFYGGVDWDFGPIGGWLLSLGVGVVTHEDPLPGDDVGAAVRALFGVHYRFKKG